MTSGQSRFPIAPSKFKFSQAGSNGLWMNTELMPYQSKIVDDLCLIRSMHTEAINHEPAITAMQTGSQVARPSVHRIVAQLRPGRAQLRPAGLRRAGRRADQPRADAGDLRASLVGRFPARRTCRRELPHRAATRSCSSTIRPASPATCAAASSNGLKALNEMNYKLVGDPETHTRIQQFEMAFRMQSSVPELTQISAEPDSTYKLYGEEAKKPGTFAYSALLARRLVERGVRFVQIYHNNWDHHGNCRRPHARTSARTSTSRSTD